MPLTLVSAPAGFGKTTLLVNWANAVTTPLAWLTADPADRELLRFVSHVIAAVQAVAPHLDLDEIVHDAFRRPQTVSPVEFGRTLADALLDAHQRVILVVDDYHLAASVAVESFVNGLLQAMPPEFHLVLATRNDPTLPLARMRLQGQVLELRGEDLRFTEDETRMLLATSGGRAGALAHSKVLLQATGGWVAGLRLVSLALPRSEDPTRIVDAIAGDQHVMDFLVDEVLEKLPGDVQDFLLRTVVVDRVSAPLAEALVDTPPPGRCRALLVTLSRERFFFEAVGDDGVWYRHHPLMRSLLQHQLEMRFSALAIEDLHARASVWFIEQELIDDAIRHCLAADDMMTATLLVEEYAHIALAQEDWLSLATWLQRLPAERIAGNPNLLLAKAWVAHLSGRLGPVREMLATVRALLDREETDPAFREALLAECDALSLVQLLTIDQNPQAAVSKARAAANRILPDHRFARGLAYFACGCALQAAGRTDDAVRWLTAMAEREAERIDAGSIRTLMGMVFVLRQAGRYHECQRVAHDMLALAERHGLPVSQGWAHWALGWIAYEQNDLETAIAHFSAIAADRRRLHLSCVGDGMFGLALSYQASARPLEAMAIVRQLTETVLDAHAMAFLPSLHLFEAHLMLLRTGAPPAIEALYASDASLEGSTLLAFEHEVMTLVKLLLAEGSQKSLHAARQHVERLRAAAEAGHHRARLIEILALAALVCEADGERERALGYLEYSLALGAPEGFCRTYLDLAPAITPLLRQLVKHGKQTAYLDRLLALLDEEEKSDPSQEPPSAVVSPAHVLNVLTMREAEVLNALCRRLTYREIAQELFISLPTVKSHTNHIYEKLGVANRRQALAKVESLGWLPGDRLTSRFA